jgi:hypothetical protein
MSDGAVAVGIAAFAAGVVLTLVISVVIYLVTSRQGDGVGGRGGGAGRDKAWDDLEQGDRSALSVEATNGAASSLTPRQLCGTLRSLLEEEIARGFRRAGLVERLDRLEREVCRSDRGEPTEEGADTKLRACALTRTPNSSDRSGGASTSPTEDLALPGAVFGPLSPPPIQVAVPLPAGDAPPRLALGPTQRQRAALEPPEANRPAQMSDKETALQTSLITVQRALNARDAQTTELHRQLKEVRKELWLQTSLERDTSAKLHGLLADPSRAPQAQAEALRDLSEEVKSLSTRLAEAQEQEKQWSTIAKRQRAFFFQNEHMLQNWGHEGPSLVRKHPAGEIFLVPPPVILGDEEDVQPESRWDVGTSHCNPYKVDSWPFEPNVLAQRASREPDPDLNRWDEGLEEDGSEEVDIPDVSEDDDFAPSEEGQEEEQLEQLGPGRVGRLPPLPASPGFSGSDSARSL